MDAESLRGVVASLLRPMDAAYNDAVHRTPQQVWQIHHETDRVPTAPDIPLWSTTQVKPFSAESRVSGWRASSKLAWSSCRTLRC